MVEGLTVGLGSMMEAGIGAAAVLQLAAVVPDLPYPLETSGAATFAQNDIIRTPFRVQDGKIDIPDVPGLGVEVDEDLLARYRVEL